MGLYYPQGALESSPLPSAESYSSLTFPFLDNPSDPNESEYDPETGLTWVPEDQSWQAVDPSEEATSTLAGAPEPPPGAGDEAPAAGG